ncbi:hypothetical protein NGA66_04550 [Lactococcus formosensis]|uniref:WxL domain-containing protein n=1 Tax=Lactococcus formosensis TaxID=1281486 RepID=A0A9X4P2K2_9LACT|nr:hypothetical protein [Lactococcus formosensis]MDG6111549.1 hypothetical protein [Lactococcus formosensis]MDG6117749.1 hypothetical protein [Lactococcus formosensis]MDG6138497.1 hypothetical protein [Lactococcus formosensis]MDG6146208.1 hypothetical protein [Lactococcus formosensis]MDG6153318.1 hypothetical protein [Lactococcus formosensis]
MINKKAVASVLTGMVALGISSPVFAAEGDYQTISGKDGQTSAEVITRGNLGEIDPTDPETPLPEGDERWIKVTLPTAVVFESEDQETITSPKNYELKNESGRPVKVDVASYNITGGDGVPALTELNIKRSAGYQGNETVNLVTGTASVKNYAINEEFVRLANNEGNFGSVTGTGANTTNFEFTGKVDKDALSDKSNYVESKLNFKFTALRMDGQTVEEAAATK